MDSLTRFSNHVENYIKYRPGYSEEIIRWLQTNYELPPGSTIADIGSGTGISSEQFLKSGYLVTGVEPNAAMRAASVQLLKKHPGFKAINGTAEATTLPYNSVAAIIAGQAFHWFDVAKAKTEFERILKPDGLVILIWNEKLTNSAFEKEYDQLIIKYGKDYVQVDHRNISTENIEQFFSPQKYQLKIFPNQQVFDFEGLKERLLSFSYMPTPEEKGFEAMINDIQQLFNKHSKAGVITIHYDTKVYVGIFTV